MKRLDIDADIVKKKKKGLDTLKNLNNIALLEIPDLSFRFLLIFENNLHRRTERVIALPTLPAFDGRKITNRTKGMLGEVNNVNYLSISIQVFPIFDKY